MVFDFFHWMTSPWIAWVSRLSAFLVFMAAYAVMRAVYCGGEHWVVMVTIVNALVHITIDQTENG